MRLALLLTVPLVIAGPATAAEDFSGFYAGFNAGHASGRDRGVRLGEPASGAPGGWERPDTRLPPSAAVAVGSLRRPGRAAGPPSAR